MGWFAMVRATLHEVRGGRKPSLDASRAPPDHLRGVSIRFANVRGRASLLVGDGVVDVERASGGRFAADPMAAVASWSEFADWAAGLRLGEAQGPLIEADLGAPVPRPRSVFAIGLIGFALASIGCAIAPSLPLLIVSRTLQGAAGALECSLRGACIAERTDLDHPATLGGGRGSGRGHPSWRRAEAERGGGGRRS